MVKLQPSWDEINQLPTALTDDGKELPKTATMNYNYLLVGALLLLMGSLAYLYARKRIKNLS